MNQAAVLGLLLIIIGITGIIVFGIVAIIYLIGMLIQRFKREK